MKRPKNLLLSDSSLKKAAVLMKVMDIDTFSGLVQTLIRQEYERRNGPTSVADAPEKKRRAATPRYDSKGSLVIA